MVQVKEYELTTSAELKCAYAAYGKLPMSFFPLKYLHLINNLKKTPNQTKTKTNKKPVLWYQKM